MGLHPPATGIRKGSLSPILVLQQKSESINICYIGMSYINSIFLMIKKNKAWIKGHPGTREPPHQVFDSHHSTLITPVEE